MQRPYLLSCHCGAIRLEVDAELTGLVECNCSSCARHGFLHWKVPVEAVRLVTEKVTLSTYHWRDAFGGHEFCPRCGTGMLRTGSEPESTAVDGRAVGYQRKDRAWVDNAGQLPYRGMAAGGSYSTARDLFALGDALRSGRLLKPETLALASTASSEDGWYGLGMMVNRGEGPRWYGHDGGAPGMSAYLRVFPDSGYVVVALSNLDPPRANWVGDVFANRMPLAPPPLPAAAPDTAAAAPEPPAAAAADDAPR